MQLSPGKLMGMKRLSDENGIFKMTAVDQRPPIKKPIEDFLKVREAPWNEVARFKKMLVENLQDKSSALLLDPPFALPLYFLCILFILPLKPVHNSLIFTLYYLCASFISLYILHASFISLYVSFMLPSPFLYI